MALVLLGACRTPLATALAVPNRSFGGIAARADGGPKSVVADPACAAMLEEEGGARDAQTNAQDGGPLVFCASSALGAWGVRLDPPSPEGTRRVTLTLLYVDRGGWKVRSASSINDQGRWPSLSASNMTVFDYDGDGIPEMFVTVTSSGLYPFVLERFFVTASRSGIAPYTPARGLRIDRLEDVDHDGRPDAIVFFPVFPVARAARCSCNDGQECLDNDEPITTEFVGHARAAGDFALDDAVAVAEARKKCSAEPSIELDATSDSKPIDADAIVCARMWGATTPELTDQLDRECRPFARDTARCQGPCRDLDVARRAAHFRPPLVFTRSR